MFGSSDEDYSFEGFSDVSTESEDEIATSLSTYVVGDEMITKDSGKRDNVKMFLPKYIILKDVKPGEPEYMRPVSYTHLTLPTNREV